MAAPLTLASFCVIAFAIYEFVQLATTVVGI